MSNSTSVLSSLSWSFQYGLMSAIAPDSGFDFLVGLMGTHVVQCPTTNLSTTLAWHRAGDSIMFRITKVN